MLLLRRRGGLREELLGANEFGLGDGDGFRRFGLGWRGGGGLFCDFFLIFGGFRVGFGGEYGLKETRFRAGA